MDSMLFAINIRRVLEYSLKQKLIISSLNIILAIFGSYSSYLYNMSIVLLKHCMMISDEIKIEPFTGDTKFRWKVFQFL